MSSFPFSPFILLDLADQTTSTIAVPIFGTTGPVQLQSSRERTPLDEDSHPGLDLLDTTHAEEIITPIIPISCPVLNQLPTNNHSLPQHELHFDPALPNLQDYSLNSSVHSSSPNASPRDTSSYQQSSQSNTTLPHFNTHHVPPQRTPHIASLCIISPWGTSSKPFSFSSMTTIITVCCLILMVSFTSALAPIPDGEATHENILAQLYSLTTMSQVYDDPQKYRQLLSVYAALPPNILSQGLTNNEPRIRFATLQTWYELLLFGTIHSETPSHELLQAVLRRTAPTSSSLHTTEGDSDQSQNHRITALWQVVLGMKTKQHQAWKISITQHTNGDDSNNNELTKTIEEDSIDENHRAEDISEFFSEAVHYRHEPTGTPLPSHSRDKRSIDIHDDDNNNDDDLMTDQDDSGDNDKRRRRRQQQRLSHISPSIQGLSQNIFTYMGTLPRDVHVTKENQFLAEEFTLDAILRLKSLHEVTEHQHHDKHSMISMLEEMNEKLHTFSELYGIPGILMSRDYGVELDQKAALAAAAAAAALASSSDAPPPSPDTYTVPDDPLEVIPQDEIESDNKHRHALQQYLIQSLSQTQRHSTDPFIRAESACKHYLKPSRRVMRAYHEVENSFLIVINPLLHMLSIDTTPENRHLGLDCLKLITIYYPATTVVTIPVLRRISGEIIADDPTIGSHFLASSATLTNSNVNSRFLAKVARLHLSGLFYSDNERFYDVTRDSKHVAMHVVVQAQQHQQPRQQSSFASSAAAVAAAASNESPNQQQPCETQSSCTTTPPSVPLSPEMKTKLLAKNHYKNKHLLDADACHRLYPHPQQFLSQISADLPAGSSASSSSSVTGLIDGGVFPHPLIYYGRDSAQLDILLTEMHDIAALSEDHSVLYEAVRALLSSRMTTRHLQTFYELIVSPFDDINLFALHGVKRVAMIASVPITVHLGDQHSTSTPNTVEQAAIGVLSSATSSSPDHGSNQQNHIPIASDDAAAATTTPNQSEIGSKSIPSVSAVSQAEIIGILEPNIGTLAIKLLKHATKKHPSQSMRISSQYVFHDVIIEIKSQLEKWRAAMQVLGKEVIYGSVDAASATSSHKTAATPPNAPSLQRIVGEWVKQHDALGHAAADAQTTGGGSDGGEHSTKSSTYLSKLRNFIAKQQAEDELQAQQQAALRGVTGLQQVLL